MNLWHDIPAFKDDDSGVFNTVVEIPKSCKNKYEVDKQLGIIRVDRVLHSASIYPHNYGFIPRSYAEDNDPLDVLLLSQTLIHPGCVTYSKAIGVMQMTDGGLIDSKILAVQIGDPAFNHYNDVSELPGYMTQEIKRFFEEYKILEKKEVLVEDFESAEKARIIIAACIRKYNEKFSSYVPKEDKLSLQITL
jgi:inorganic pyrophosphatase